MTERRVLIGDTRTEPTIADDSLDDSAWTAVMDGLSPWRPGAALDTGFEEPAPEGP